MSTAECPATLIYINEEIPGITRKALKHGWAYFHSSGERITNRDEIDRLNAIGMPPAYERCWFCADPNGHLQATGYDAKGRKQYRYHAEFRASQEAGKYDRCGEFGRKLAKLRARVERDLQGRKLARDTIVAAVVRLLDTGLIRVGNEAYARTNRSFGATTLRRRHVAFSGKRVRLQFRGKSGKTHTLTITDRRLSGLVRRCQDLPGQHLFQYLDEAGGAHPVGSADVNAYISETVGPGFTAKNFRTWGASLVAFETLLAAEGRISVKSLIEPVSAALGNTPAIARKSYIHPALIEAAQAGGLPKGLKLPRSTTYLSATERGLIAWLESYESQAQPKVA